MTATALPLGEIDTRNPEDVAAEMFQTYYPNIKRGLHGQSKKDLVRYIEALVGFPLEIQDVNFHNKSLSQHFYLALQLIEAKYIMKNFLEMEEAEEMMKKRAEQETAETKKEEEKTNE